MPKNAKLLGEIEFVLSFLKESINPSEHNSKEGLEDRVKYAVFQLERAMKTAKEE